MSVGEKIGEKIHAFRKARQLTLGELAEKICKSKSTVSKYESGEITLDVDTLYEIAKALQVHIDQLFCPQPEVVLAEQNRLDSPGFFRGLSTFFGYFYDGRSGQLIRCVFDEITPLENQQYHIRLYMNCKEFSRYQDCENTYEGIMEHYDALTYMSLRNQETPMEKASLQVLAPYLDAPVKWGLWNGLSSRPMMPVAMKMLLAKQPLKEDETLLKMVKISKEDIRLLKLYNMLPVT